MKKVTDADHLAKLVRATEAVEANAKQLIAELRKSHDEQQRDIDRLHRRVDEIAKRDRTTIPYSWHGETKYFPSTRGH